MSAFAFDPDDLDEDALEVLAELSEEDLAELTDAELAELLEGSADDEDPLAGYARSAARRPPAGRRSITDLPPI
ncbi:hypothetical protein DMA15_12555 [Streptomyces sp. WAC 01529]|uniref:hypothetical protein n=1 Tax=Streptomyces sp. WAC 01529 TaxID=2203205 RepID=UPI000F719AF0|nr:hypothetical protein [Streptomyces sp. WAC 01529]AZM53315.1 hypothetical protein DMA15_12555 [Streptomyces sp. WAC 01529]